MKHVINKMWKNKNQNIPPAIDMKRLNIRGRKIKIYIDIQVATLLSKNTLNSNVQRQDTTEKK